MLAHRARRSIPLLRNELRATRSVGEFPSEEQPVASPSLFGFVPIGTRCEQPVPCGEAPHSEQTVTSLFRLESFPRWPRLLPAWSARDLSMRGTLSPAYLRVERLPPWDQTVTSLVRLGAPRWIRLLPAWSIRGMFPLGADCIPPAPFGDPLRSGLTSVRSVQGFLHSERTASSPVRLEISPWARTAYSPLRLGLVPQGSPRVPP